MKSRIPTTCSSGKIGAWNGGISLRQHGPFLFIGTGVGVVLSFVSRPVGISVGIVLMLIGILLLIRAYMAKAKPKPLPLPLDRSVKEKLPDGRILTTYPPNLFSGTPGGENQVQKVMFKTESRQNLLIPTIGNPYKLRFLFPHEQIVSKNELPVEIPTGDGRIVIKKFTPKGFLIDEVGTLDVEVMVEIYSNIEIMRDSK